MSRMLLLCGAALLAALAVGAGPPPAGPRVPRRHFRPSQVLGALSTFRLSRNVPIGVALPPWRRRSDRVGRQELELAVPETLDVLRATVAAGAAPGQGLKAAAEAASGPLTSVFEEALRRHSLGRTAGRALADAATAAGSAELATVGEALDLAATTGAPPGEVLAAVAEAAVDRLRARQARLAATAQARLSAKVVAAMAPAFLCLLAVVAPGDVAFLVRTPAGLATLLGALAFEAAGMLWARRIVDGAA